MVAGKILSKMSLVFLATLFSICVGFELYLRRIGFLQAQSASYPCVVGDPELNPIFQSNCRVGALVEIEFLRHLNSSWSVP